MPTRSRSKTSPLIWRVLPLLIAATLVFGFWGDLLRVFGAGVALLIVATVILTWVIWQRRFSLFIRYWNCWLSAIVFAAALLGLLGLL